MQYQGHPPLPHQDSFSFDDFNFLTAFGFDDEPQKVLEDAVIWQVHASCNNIFSMFWPEDWGIESEYHRKHLLHCQIASSTQSGPDLAIHRTYRYRVEGGGPHINYLVWRLSAASPEFCSQTFPNLKMAFRLAVCWTL